MTLLIACLLIYNFKMAWWWYAIAAGIWAIKMTLIDEAIKRNARTLIAMLKQS